MALALRSQTPPSPQTTHKNSRNYRTAETVNHSAESTFTTTTSMSPTSTATTSRQHINRSPAQQIKSKILNERPNGIGDLYSGGSSSSDNDGVNTSSSSSATALRRLYFKSGRSTKTKANTNKSSMSMTQITKNAICTAAVLYHSSVEGTLGVAGNTSTSKSVPKVVVMGSSTASASDTIINTSTDSASTMITNVTHTDTSETCDSLDLVECVSGDNSGQSEPLFSSLEEPLLTAIQVDSEQEGTEIELTSCSSYSRPDMNLQESTESQESCLSILTGEPSSTTPLLSSHRKHSPISTGYGDKERERERVPNTAPAPTSGGKHFTFDKPQSPKSARCSDKSRTCFTFKDEAEQRNYIKQHQKQQQQQQHQQQQCLSKYMDEGLTYDKCNSSNERLPTRTYPSQKSNNTTGVTNADVTHFNSSKKSRNETAERNRYSMAGTATHKTSPKRERRRSPSSSTSKVNSAPPTMKDSNFFGSNSSPTRLNNKQLSPTSQSSGQRKYSSSSSSGGSERYKDGILFPFDREAIDYERIQRECFALKEHSSSSTTTSDSDEPEPCSVYERSKATISPKPTEFYKQYSLLSQKEQQQQHSQTSSRKNSKRLRSDSLAQKYIPKSDAFSPKSKTSSPTHNAHHSPNSQIELNKFEDIASKFDQMPPKHGSIVNLATKTTSPLSSCSQISNLKNNNNNSYMSNNNIESISSNASSPTNSRSTTPPLPNLRVDFFMEKSTQSRKKSFKNKPKTASAIEEVDTITTTNTAHDFLGDCQYVVGSSNALAAANVVINSGGPINVTANPMEVAAVCTQPRATIVVQQPSLSLDNTIETLLIKNENDFISVEQDKDPQNIITLSARKRHSQQFHQAPNTAGTQHQNYQQQQQQKRDENMRQLLDVTNTLTFEELRDFEMRYGSPHHSRSQSVKTPGSRASGRPNQLCLPQQRSRVASMPNTGVEEEYYRLRHFSITGKGVINRGDSLKSRRSKSNNSVASSNSSNEHLTTQLQPTQVHSARNSATCSLASSRESSTSNPGSGPYRVLMLGGTAVGKSSLVSQFMTSEYLHAYDTSIVVFSVAETYITSINGQSKYCPKRRNLVEISRLAGRLGVQKRASLWNLHMIVNFIETSVGINHNVRIIGWVILNKFFKIIIKILRFIFLDNVLENVLLENQKQELVPPLSGRLFKRGGSLTKYTYGPTNSIYNMMSITTGSAHRDIIKQIFIKYLLFNKYKNFIEK
ncbi:hypothetical protein CVS40_2846 [Lucilia cuprina]|nr:hypothetical protein CVS40_2846 [Lucilia cuprina]